MNGCCLSRIKLSISVAGKSGQAHILPPPPTNTIPRTPQELASEFPNGISIASAVLHSSSVCCPHTNRHTTELATCIATGRICGYCKCTPEHYRPVLRQFLAVYSSLLDNYKIIEYHAVLVQARCLAAKSVSYRLDIDRIRKGTKLQIQGPTVNAQGSKVCRK